MKFLKIFSLIATLFMTACSAKATNPNVEVVSPKEFQTKLTEDTSAYLLDVRKPDEFAAGHLAGAHLLNWLDTEAFKADAKNLDKEKTIYVYCRSGRRSNAAANYLAEQGYKVVDMDGGILAWEKAVLPITKDEPANPVGGRTYTGSGNGGGLATNLTIKFDKDGKCQCTSDFYQAFAKPVTVDGTYSIRYDIVEVHCQPEGFDSPIVWNFEIINDGQELGFNNSDTSEEGSIGRDWLQLKAE